MLGVGVVLLGCGSTIEPPPECGPSTLRFDGFVMPVAREGVCTAEVNGPAVTRVVWDISTQPTLTVGLRELRTSAEALPSLTTQVEIRTETGSVLGGQGGFLYSPPSATSTGVSSLPLIHPVYAQLLQRELCADSVPSGCLVQASPPRERTLSVVVTPSACGAPQVAPRVLTVRVCCGCLRSRPPTPVDRCDDPVLRQDPCGGVRAE